TVLGRITAFPLLEETRTALPVRGVHPGGHRQRGCRPVEAGSIRHHEMLLGFTRERAAQADMTCGRARSILGNSKVSGACHVGFVCRAVHMPDTHEAVCRTEHSDTAGTV